MNQSKTEVFVEQPGNTGSVGKFNNCLHVLTQGLLLHLSKLGTLDNNKDFLLLCFYVFLCFLQNLNCKVWDQARLSSLA